MQSFNYLPTSNTEKYQRYLGLDNIQLSAFQFVEAILTKPYCALIQTEVRFRNQWELNHWKIDLSLARFQQSSFYKKLRSIDPALPAIVLPVNLSGDTDSTHRVGNTMRPNHGIAHTLRVTYYVSKILRHFCEFGENKAAFLQLDNPDTLLQIQYLALFSVTGRLNEFGWPSKPMTTAYYFRWRASQFFYHYMTRLDADNKPNYLSCGFSSKEALDAATVHLADMGTDANIEPMHIVLNAAHRLDLMRCSNDDKHFYERFDRFMLLHTDNEGSLTDLKQTAYDLLVATGDHDIDGGPNKPLFSNYVQPLLDVANHSAARCFELMYHALTKRSNTIRNHFFAVRVSAPETKDNLTYYGNQLLSSVNHAINIKNRIVENHPRRGSFKRLSTITLINDDEYAIVKRHLKKPRHTQEQKEGFSPIIAVSLREPLSRQPVFTSNRDELAHSLATSIRLKISKKKRSNLLFNHLFISDSDSFQRESYDFDRSIDARKALNRSNKITAPTPSDEFTLVTPSHLSVLLSAPNLQQDYNEALVRLKCHYTDNNLSIGIHAPTLEACLIAQARANHVKRRMAEQAREEGKSLPANFQVNIYFDLPYFSNHGKRYTEQQQVEHREQARQLLLKNPYSGNHVLLLSLDNPNDIYNKFVEHDLFRTIVLYSTHEMYILELLIQPLPDRIKLNLSRYINSIMTTSDFSNAYLYAARHGYINVLKTLGSTYLLIHPINNIFKVAIKTGQYSIVKWLLQQGCITHSSNWYTAAKYGQTEICQLLLRHRPGLLLQLDNDGYSALGYAATYGRDKTFRYLLSQYSDTETKRLHLNYAFYPACVNNNVTILVQIAGFLKIFNCAFVNECYYHALFNGANEACNYLISLGVQAEITSLHELIALFQQPKPRAILAFASQLERQQLLKYLAYKNTAGFTPLMTILGYFTENYNHAASINIYQLLNFLAEKKFFTDDVISEKDNNNANLKTYILTFLNAGHLHWLINHRVNVSSLYKTRFFHHTGDKCVLDRESWNSLLDQLTPKQHSLSS